MYIKVHEVVDLTTYKNNQQRHLARITCQSYVNKRRFIVAEANCTHPELERLIMGSATENEGNMFRKSGCTYIQLDGEESETERTFRIQLVKFFKKEVKH